jgi:hypothetical protein
LRAAISEAHCATQSQQRNKAIAPYDRGASRSRSAGRQFAAIASQFSTILKQLARGAQHEKAHCAIHLTTAK